MPRFRYARLVSGVGLAAADAVALLGCVAAIYLFRAAVWGGVPFFWGVWPVCAGWMVFRLAAGLYPPFGMPQPEELRRSVRTTALAMLLHLGILLAGQELEAYRFAGLGIWLLAVPACHFARGFAKARLIRRGFYCTPYVVIGAGPLAQAAIQEMHADAELGVVPVGAFGDVGRLRTPALQGVPVLGPVEAAADYAFPWPIRHGLIALGPDEADRGQVEKIAADLARSFPRLQILSDFSFLGNLWARPRPLGPYLATEVRQVRFSDRQRRAKRLFDLVVSVPLMVLAAPIIGIAAVAVKLVSPGPAFCTQTCEGMAGRWIRVHKLRTMVPDAEKRLQEYLAVNPAARFEWERTLKLQHDPRTIPRIGRFLQRSRIDELPQLLNILKGDMSLVGPRVMTTHEVEQYSATGQALRRDVPPGLTGLWQVTSRGDSDLKVREIADSFYVSNWSVWLDAWVLLRTVRVVLAGSGA